MRIYPIVVIVMLTIIILPDLFIFLRLKKKNLGLFVQILSLLPAFIFLSFLAWLKLGKVNFHESYQLKIIIWMNYAFLLIYIPKLIYVIFYFLNYLINSIFKKKYKLLTRVGLVLGVFVIVNLLIGAFYTPYNFQLKKTNVYIKNLPASFDGYKIIQISDIHLGSWDKNFKILETVIQMINSQNADIILFSGDLVNNFSEETIGWDKYFIQLKSKSGNFAVLGNHDYGDYSFWVSKKDKQANLDRIKQAIHDFGFKLLLNENKTLYKGSDSISLIGVENWGKPPFPKYGNLNKALSGISENTIQILITHDPSHWEAEVVGKQNIALTFSGHTHAAQMGIKIGQILHSPSSFIYKQFDGLYEKNNQFIYVNRGLGFIGLPLRIGVPPEISLITLKKAK